MYNYFMVWAVLFRKLTPKLWFVEKIVYYTHTETNKCYNNLWVHVDPLLTIQECRLYTRQLRNLEALESERRHLHLER